MNKKTIKFSIVLIALCFNVLPAYAMYDEFTNNYILFTHLKKIPPLIEKSAREACVHKWQLPHLCTEWNPRETPYAPTTSEGCLAECENGALRALITPWGRIILFEKAYNPLLQKIAPLIWKHIELGAERTDLKSLWHETSEETSGVFEIKKIYNNNLQTPLVRKKVDEQDALKINAAWEKTLEKYSEDDDNQELIEEIKEILSNSPHRSCLLTPKAVHNQELTFFEESPK